MGNIQKKLTGKSEGGKRPEKGAPRRGRAPGAGADKRGRLRAPAAAGSGRGAGDSAAAAAPAGPVPAATLGPADLKSQGNELFKSGQFAEAALKYSAAVAQLEPAGRRGAAARLTGARAGADRAQRGVGRPRASGILERAARAPLRAPGGLWDRSAPRRLALMDFNRV